MTKIYNPKTDRKNASTKPKAIPDKFQVGFLEGLDKRTDLARALKANRDAVVEDIGGRDSVSHIKAALVERFIWLECILQSIEHDMSTGKVDKGAVLGSWVQSVNALSGLAKVLGVEGKARAMPWATILANDTPADPPTRGKAKRCDDGDKGEVVLAGVQDGTADLASELRDK